MEWGRIAAAGTLVMAPVVVFTLVVRKWLVQGLTAGGLDWNKRKDMASIELRQLSKR